MSVTVPPMKEELSNSLKEIIDTKHYYSLKHESWDQMLLPQIIQRFETLISLIPDSEEYKDTNTKGNKILNHLKAYFNESPPFSVLRMAEVLYDPTKEGYKLDTITGIKKYLNAFSKIIFVTFTVEDFPEPSFKDEGSENKAEDIPLVKIPWLEEIPQTSLTQEPPSSPNAVQDKRPMEPVEEPETKRTKTEVFEKEGSEEDEKKEEEDSMDMETSANMDSSSSPQKEVVDKENDDLDDDKLDMSIDNEEGNET